jgi:hypothetical protein
VHGPRCASPLFGRSLIRASIRLLPLIVLVRRCDLPPPLDPKEGIPTPNTKERDRSNIGCQQQFDLSPFFRRGQFDGKAGRFSYCCGQIGGLITLLSQYVLPTCRK